MSDAPVYPIGVARRLTGLSDRQLRYCETRGIVRPLRSSGGQRLYSQRDVAVLLRVRYWRSQGLTLREVQARVAREGAQAAGGPAAAFEDAQHHFGLASPPAVRDRGSRSSTRP